MLFCLGLFFNFLIGGVSGVFLSDVPVGRHRARQLLRDGALPLHDHGRADLRLLGRLLLLAPEDDRASSSTRRWARSHFWTDVHLLQLHVLAAVRGRPARACRAGSSSTRSTCRRSMTASSISSFLLGGSILHLLRSTSSGRRSSTRDREAGNPWQSRGLEWQVSSPPPPGNFDHIPVILLRACMNTAFPDAPPVADLQPAGGRGERLLRDCRSGVTIRRPRLSRPTTLKVADLVLIPGQRAGNVSRGPPHHRRRPALDLVIRPPPTARRICF